ncbi:MAG: YggS family pyridoxal phosphate-dependent enzyme [Candidatus Micrarchaeia archaeon]
MDQLYENVKRVKERIAEAAKRVGRKPEEITILYATKYASPETVARLLEFEDKLIIGENYVQDAKKKFDELRVLLGEEKWERVEKHMIGTLQTNKVKKALEIFDVVHSVDSLKLAQKIDQKAGEMGKEVPVFVEVNAGEETKHGIKFDEIDGFIAEMKKMGNIKVVGLMTMAPHAEPESVRPMFRRLKDACNRHGLKASMGMTNDFEVAIEEGSDIVRIGRAVFEGC